jgi:predicted nucleic acid-binding protein
MTTAIDSKVLIDLIGEKTVFTDASISALDAARMDGALIVCPVVVAEISGHFSTPAALLSALADMQIVIEECDAGALHLAGTAFIRYRQRSAKPRERMLADFLVGAHAQHQADTLLTRDRGYYRTYFPKLHVVDAGRS